MFCKFCGQQVDDNAFACTNCGGILKETAPVQPTQPTQPVYEQTAYTQPYGQQPYMQQPYAQPAPTPVVPREPMSEEKKEKLLKIFIYCTIGLLCLTVMFYLFGIGGMYYYETSASSYSTACTDISQLADIGGGLSAPSGLYIPKTKVMIDLGWGVYVGFAVSACSMGTAIVAFIFSLKLKKADYKMLCIFLLSFTSALFLGGIGLMCL